MDAELAMILKTHKPKKKSDVSDEKNTINHSIDGLFQTPNATFTEIPDIFYDDILVNIRLSRIEIITLLALYRRVWCKPNLYRKYGIGPLLSYEDLEGQLKISMDELYSSLHRLESLELIETIRPGQYFIRRYFTTQWDEHYGQSYDE